MTHFVILLVVAILLLLLFLIFTTIGRFFFPRRHKTLVRFSNSLTNVYNK